MKVKQVQTRKKEGVVGGFRAVRRERQSSPAAFNPIALLSRSPEEDYPQAKLKVGSPGDIYEKEADQVADRVISMPEPVVQRQIEEEEEPVQEKPVLQRQVEEEEEPVQEKTVLQRQDEEEEEEPVQGQTSKPEPKRKACVGPESIPKDHIGATGRQMTVQDYFEMNIDWKKRSKQNPTCDCSCGEYRQYVKGYVKVNQKPIKKQLAGNTFLNDKDYQEDGEDGIPYGHRDLPERPYDKFVDPASPDTPVDRKTACGYRGRDTPGVDIVPSGSHLDMHLEFIGQTYDRCNKTYGKPHKWVTEWNDPVP